MPYYHVSSVFHGCKPIWHPRIPKSATEPLEDKTIPRISFAPTLKQCLMAVAGHPDWKAGHLQLSWPGKLRRIRPIYVYAISARIKVLKPSLDEVPDVDRTGEVWRTMPTLLYYKGQLKIKNGEPVIER